MSLIVPFTDLTLGGSVWLKEWSETNQKTGANDDVIKFIGIYFAFGVGASALSVVQTLVLWIFCSIEVGPLVVGHTMADTNSREGIPETAREDGQRHFPVSDVVL